MFTRKVKARFIAEAEPVTDFLETFISYAQQNGAMCLLMFCLMKNCCEHILKETIK